MARHPFLGPLFAAAALAATGLPGFAQTAAPQAGPADQPPPAVAPAAVPAEAEGQNYARDIPMGEADAPVTFIEYGSFTCPHCAAFSNEVFPELKRDYIDTGKVRFVHREVYFDRYGLWAAMVARCGGDMRYYGFVKTLYATQRDWAGSDDPAVVGENLRRLARTAGLTEAEVNTCLTDNEMAKALVVAYQERSTADGVSSTPTFIINGEKHQNMSYEELKKVLDAQLN